MKVVHWKNALAAAEGAKPAKTFTEDFNSIWLSEDMGAYTIAFVPKGVDVPPPPGAAQIQQNAQIDAGAQNTGSTLPQNTLPPDTTPPSETTAPGSGTTAPGGDSTPETTATTNPTG